MTTLYLNANQLAARLGVRPETILTWRRRGWIPSIQGGKRPVLFDEQAVISALKTRADEAIGR